MVTRTVQIALGLFIAASSSVSLAADTRLHPLEAYWIKYSQEGMMQSGEIVQQCRNWCNEMAETTKTTMSMGGFSQSTNQKSITIRDTIYNVDLDKGTVTKTANPMYDSLVQSLQNSGNDQTAMMQAWLKALGYQSTGNTRTVAGETCTDYTSAQLMGSTTCLTDDGLALYTEVAVAGMQPMVRKAVEVRRNDPGKAEDYGIPKGSTPAAVKQPAGMPDMKQIQEMLKNMPQVPSQ